MIATKILTFAALASAAIGAASVVDVATERLDGRPALSCAILCGPCSPLSKIQDVTQGGESHE